MSCPLDEQALAQFKTLIKLCKSQPQILHHPKLSFFKEYLASLGAVIPTAKFDTSDFSSSGDTNANKKEAPDNAQSPSKEESEPESDLQLNMEGVIEGDPIDNSQQMGDAEKEPSDEDRDQSDEKRTEAMKAFYEQNFDEAIKLYTEAIELNPQSALLFAKRGQVYLKLNKPNACIKDCTRALELNCDSAAAYKFRGRAYRLLGKFEEAFHDLCESLKVDYDDETNEWLNEVKPNAEKLRQHKLSVQRKKEETEHQEKVRRAQEAHSSRAKTEAGAQAQAAPEGMSGSFPENIDYTVTPEIFSILEDPEVMQAILELSENGDANVLKYQNNEKVMAAFQKLRDFHLKGGLKPFTVGAKAKEVPKEENFDDVGLD